MSIRFDWRAFCQRYRIEYQESGKNVKRGNINIHCPFCGHRDPSHHLGLDTTSSRWGCWRDADHRGSRPDRLIVALIRCTWQEARDLCGGDELVGDVGLPGLKEKADALFDRPKREVWKPKPLDREPSHKPIDKNRRSTMRFWRYLEKRCFTDVDRVISNYHLRACFVGSMKGRLIIPFFYNDQMVGWTARGIGKRMVPKYISQPSSEDVKKIVFNYDNAARGGDTLVIVEGPLDALKLDFYGREHKHRAVALLGISPTPEQIQRLMGLSKMYQNILIMLDPEALAQSMKLQATLSIIKPRVSTWFPQGCEDPGALKPAQVIPTIEKNL